jgi:hypothetical protein
MRKFGQKALHFHTPKIGMKDVHTGAKLGAKLVTPLAMAGGLMAPEIAIPLTVGAQIAKPILETIEKQTK